MEQLRTRDQIPQADTWALEDLYETAENWEQELAAVEEQGKTLTAYRGRLGEGGETLFQYLELTEGLGVRISRLANYCMRFSDQDTANPQGRTMVGKFTSVAVALSARRSFETPEIMAIEEETLEGFYKEYPPLERYRRKLTQARRMKAHTLSECEERLLAAAGEMEEAPGDIFNTFVDADIRYPDAVDAEGKMHPLTSATYGPLLQSTDRTLRRSAYENLYDTLAGFKNTLAATLDAQNKQLKFFAEARRYPNAFEAALDRTNVPTQVYRNLIDTVHRNLDKFHRYVRLRRKLLGVEELHFYDVYAPLIQDGQAQIPFDQAKQTVYEALAPLGEEYRKILKKGFEGRWIDVYPNVGKRSGAYSAGANPHPYVLMNYSGTLSNQFTLAHEMGHSLHSYLSYQKQNPVDANYVIFVAEVASTCNEALLMEYLLAKHQDRKQRAQLINHFLEQFKGTIYRQTMFAEFELMVGELTAQGKTLTAQELCQRYKELNRQYFGPDMVVDDRIAMEWARIPHFYYNYYVFQYATGYAAAIALSRRILKEGEPAVRDYLNFLSGGCTKSPIDLLKDAGVDMTGPQAVEEALALFDRLVDEMETLSGE